MTKKFRLALTLVMATLLTFSLSACGGGASSSTPVEKEQTNQTSDIQGIVKTGGSTSVEKVMNTLIYSFQESNPNVTVNYESNGSGDGIKNTLSGMYEIGHSSRNLKTDGTEDGLEAIAYAVDALAVILNPNNGVSELTKQQLHDIYTGQITNWSEVGGKSEPITVVSREEGSGSREAFRELVGIESLVANANIQNTTGAVQTQVASNEQAIGYISYSDLDENIVRALALDGVEISVENIKNDSYPLKRNFYLLKKEGETLNKEAQAFVDFVLGSEGQALVANLHLIPVQ